MQLDCFVLRYASKRMKSNEQVVLAAVQQVVRALDYASEDKNDNEKIVMAAVQEIGCALKYASEDMKVTRDCLGSCATKWSSAHARFRGNDS